MTLQEQQQRRFEQAIAFSDFPAGSVTGRRSAEQARWRKAASELLGVGQNEAAVGRASPNCPGLS